MRNAKPDAWAISTSYETPAHDLLIELFWKEVYYSKCSLDYDHADFLKCSKITGKYTFHYKVIT